MFQITDGKIESRERENLYHLPPPELDECSQNRTRVNLIAELRSNACHGVQNESYCTANMRKQGHRVEVFQSFNTQNESQLRYAALTSPSSLTKIVRLVMRASFRNLL